MLVAAVLGKRRSSLVEKPDLNAKDEFVVVKVHAAPMCTEFHAFENGDRSDSHGHEACGEVVDVDRSSRVRVGDRVVVMPQYPCGECFLCQSGYYIHCEKNRNVSQVVPSYQGTGTMAQYVIKQDWLLLPVPDGMSFDHASMACCGLGPTFGACETMQAGTGDWVLIAGLGPVGLGGVINARSRDCRVIGVDGNVYRSKLALDLGAEMVIDPSDHEGMNRILALTGGRGVDKAICTAPGQPAKTLAMHAVRRRGQIAFVAWGGAVNVDEIIAKGLTLYGAWHYPLQLAPKLMDTIANQSHAIEKLITHRFPMTRIQEAWELQVTGQCGKVILDPWG
jgi:L-iditol 2-dehydrogenase